VKVGELIAELSKLDPSSEVIMQKDAEGNGYSPLYAVDGNGIYISDSTWSGDVYDGDWTATDADMDDEEWAEMLKRPRCCVLAPTN
jgi:hypothetical protein